MLVIYVISFFILIFIFSYLYSWFKFPFWFIQPVMHYYSFYYWICKKGIINYNLPLTNKFCNFNNIETKLFPIHKNEWNDILLFIQHNYLTSGTNYFLPELHNIQPFFLYEPSFLSIYWKFIPFIDGHEIKKKKEIYGLMTSRPVHVEFISDNLNFDVYYVDYLCVKKDKRKQGIAPQIIQTHEFNQRHSNQNIKVSLFKREEEITGIIPLCIYPSYLYSLPNELNPYSSSVYDITLANKNNLYLILDFFKDIKKTGKISVWIQCPFSEIISLVDTNNFFIFFITHKKSNKILATLFFRNSRIFVDSKNVLTCFSSLFLQNIDDLQNIYYGCLFLIKDFGGFHCIENCSHNNKIIHSISQNIIVKSCCAFFFYNYSYCTISSNQCFILL